MYLLFEADAAGTDSGYAGSYTSELGPATVPTPSFEPNSVPSYNSTPILFTNSTQNIVGVPTWEWTIDGAQVKTSGIDLNLFPKDYYVQYNVVRDTTAALASPHYVPFAFAHSTAWVCRRAHALGLRHFVTARKPKGFLARRII